MIAVVLVLSSAHASTGLASDTSQSSDSLREAAHFRETFGLDADPALIDRAAQDPAYSSEPYGVPLSESEIAELQRRVGVERSVWDAVAYAEKQPEWAGYFIDQLDRGTPVFCLTAGGDEVAAGIRSLVPTDVNIRFDDASHSLAYLLELEETIFADREGSHPKASRSRDSRLTSSRIALT